VPTGWSDGPCAYFLGRVVPPAGQRIGWFLYAGLGLVTALVVSLVAAGPTVVRIRRLARDARESVGAGYTTIAPDSRRDELSSLTFVFNDAANELRLRKTRIDDLDVGLRRLVQATDEEIAGALRRLEAALGSASAADPATRAELVTSALSDVNDVSARVENLIAASRLKMSGTAGTVAEIDLVALVGRVAARYQPLASGSGVTLRAALPSAPLTVEGDEALLERAVANVVDNAIRYNGPGGEVTVRLSTAGDGRSFRLVIADTGPGMTEEAFKTLTAIRRFRGDEHRNRRPGAPGLGLAVAKEVADRFHLQLELRRPGDRGFEAEFVGPVSGAPS
jgi:signal transduction histidine kinase